MLAIMAGCLGCGQDTTPYVGSWTGEKSLDLAANTPPEIRASLSRLKLEVKRDGTFELVEESMPLAGTWHSGEGGILLEFKTLLGRSLEPHQERKPVLLKFTKGDLMYSDPEDKVPILMRRKS